MSERRANSNEEQKTYQVQSKINATTMRRLDAVVLKYGFRTRYDLVQTLISSFLRYADPATEEQDGQVNAELSKIYACMLDQRINDSKPGVGNDKLHAALLVYGNSSARKTKLLLDIDSETPQTSTSVVVAFDWFMQSFLPHRYDYLMHVAEELDSASALKALDYLIEADKRCGAPEQLDYSQNEYGIVPVRHNNRSNGEG